MMESENMDTSVESKRYALRCSVFGHEKDVRGLAALFQPDGAFVSVSRDLTSRVWVPSELDPGFTEGLMMGGHENFVVAVCVLPPDDQYPHGVIVTGSNDNKILAYTIDSPKPIYTLEGHTGTVCALAAGKFGSLVSGSWDKTAKVWLKGKCVMTLQGHEAAVWSVAIMPSGGYMLTGSADKSIRLWKAGKLEKTYLGHQDCVRCLAVLNPQQFLSCGNDSTIRRWNVTGECVQTYYGHTSFIYCIACLPNGMDFVSCGEDRTLRVWNDGLCTQTITHPTQSVWAVCVLPNGDIVTGGSDGSIRVFTNKQERMADLVEQTAFEESVSKSTIPAQIGDIQTEDLPGPEALLEPGKREGQTMMVKRVNNIEAHQWSVSEGRWIKIGDVVGGTGGTSETGGSQQSSSGKQMFEGKEYDYVFDVEIYEGKPPLKLPFNLSEDPYMAAHQFLEKNEISQMFLDQVANFIQQQTSAITLGASGGGQPSSDPFTGGSRYVPSGAGYQSDTGPSGDPYTGATRYVPGGATAAKPPVAATTANNGFFPETNYFKFDQINVQGIFSKFREFNSQAGEGSKFSESEVGQVETLVRNHSEPTPLQLEIFWRMLQWPAGVLFPALDAFRYMLLFPSFNQQFCSISANGPRFIQYACALLDPSGSSKNQFLILRALCNAFQHQTGENLILTNFDRITKEIVQLKDSTDKHIQIAASSLVLNLSIAMRKTRNLEGKVQCLSLTGELTQSLTDQEAFFRLLVAIGTAVSDDQECLTIARSLDLLNFLGLCHSDGPEKVKKCAELLAAKLTD